MDLHGSDPLSSGDLSVDIAVPHNAPRFLKQEQLVRLASIWCLVAAPLACLYLLRQLSVGWTDGQGHPFGEDFINFWSAARLSLSGAAATIYDIDAFHAFQEALVGARLDLYHYSYPPVAWLLTAPFGSIHYFPAWILWQFGGLLAFASLVRRIAPNHWLLLALAPPAVFINALGGQNGCWTAAIVGWGLILLRERPVVAGAILSLLVVKPQLAWLVPIALLSGGHWRAFLSCGASAITLVGLSLLIFGIDPWLGYIAQGAILKSVILEDGSGTWHRMMSIFVLARHAGASVTAAYGWQILASTVAAILIHQVWRREGVVNPLRVNAILILGMLAGSLYVSDYDCVMAITAVVWLWPQATERERLCLAALVVAPLFVASVAAATQLALCALLLWSAFLASAWPAARARVHKVANRDQAQTLHSSVTAVKLQK